LAHALLYGARPMPPKMTKFTAPQKSLFFQLVAAAALLGASGAFFGSLSACGPRHTDLDESLLGPASSDDDFAAGRGQGLERAQGLARQAEVSCVDGSSCPEGVAMVVTASATGVEQCTGFLVASDLLMTSPDCLPADLRADGKDCGGRITAVFPADPRDSRAGNDPRRGRPAFTAECARVGYSAGDAHAFLNFATPVPRRPLEINSDGLPEGLQVRVAAVIPASPKKPIGEIQVQNCQVAQNSAVLPEFRSDANPIGVLGSTNEGGCSAGITHRGAAVLDEHGAVRAVVKSPFLGVSQIEASYSALLNQRQLGEFSLVTNLACTPLPRSLGGTHAGVSVPAACTQTREAPTGAAAVLTDAAMARALREIKATLLPWASDKNQRLGWKFPALLREASGKPVRPFPVCIANSGSWLSEYRQWAMFGRYRKDAQVDVQIPEYSVSYELNALAQTQQMVKRTDVRAVAFFSPSQLAETGATVVSIQSYATAGHPAVLLFPRTTLKKCE
jgi:hypothetical protein